MKPRSPVPLPRDWDARVMEAFLCELVGRYVDEGREPNDVEMEFLEAMGINVIEVTP